MRCSFEPGHQVVDEHAGPPGGPGGELGEHVGQPVDAVEQLDHDALDPEVVAPHPLDQLGVVAALDEDPTGPRHLGSDTRDGHRARGGAAGRGRGGTYRRGEDDGPALEQEARAEREGATSAAAVLQREGVEVAVDGDDLTDPVGGDLLDDGPDLGGRLDGAAATARAVGGAPVAGQDVAAVPLAHVRPR